MSLKDALSAAEVDVPATAGAFLAQSEIPGCLRVETEIDAIALGGLALGGFDETLRNRLSRKCTARLAEKIEVTYQGIESTEFSGPQHVYRGEVFVFTRAELRELVEDAMRAGRLSAAVL
jgi:hypothetical protein